MVRYECDFCHRLKAPDDTWILGFALENIGVTAARREIVIASAWDPKRAVEPRSFSPGNQTQGSWLSF